MSADITTIGSVDLSTLPPLIGGVLGLANVLWIACYGMCLYVGYKDKTYCIPPIALAGNLGWEITFTVITPMQVPFLYVYLPMATLCVALTVQYFMYAKNDVHLPNMSPKWIVPVFLAAFAMSVALALTVTEHFQDKGWHHTVLVTFLDTVLWVHMLLRRNSMLGQSIYMALARTFGNLGAYVCFYFIYGPQYSIFYVVVVATHLLDFWYVGMVFVKCRQWGLNPWRLRPMADAGRQAPAVSAA